MFKKLALAILVTILFLVFAPPVSAGTQSSCAGSDNTKALLWENSIGDTSDNNDTLWVCTAVADLGKIAHTLAGNCHGSIGGDHDTWNDCTSAITVWVPAGYRLCLYDSSNYTAIWAKQSFTNVSNGKRYNLSSILNDATSSLRWIDANRAC